MCISIQQDALTAELYVSVRDAVGFYHYDREDARMALDGGLYSVAALMLMVTVRNWSCGGDVYRIFIKDLVLRTTRDGVCTAVLARIITHSRTLPQITYIGSMATLARNLPDEEHGSAPPALVMAVIIRTC